MILLMSHWIFLVILTFFSIIAFAEQKHECNRHCVIGAAQLKCRYDFVVTQIETTDTICRNNEENNCIDQPTNRAFVINNTSPGPTIEVCLGDTVEVFIHNKLLSQEISIHWNGIRQLGSSHMDGVTMISQCPILPYTSFRYDMKPNNNGTYFYHAHIVDQQKDGLYGALIVRSPEDNLSMEKLLIMSAKSSSISSGFYNIQKPSPTALIINGKANNVDFHVDSGSEYRLRLINANVFNCPIVFYINDHSLKVNAIGDNLVDQSKVAHYVLIFPGERLDILLETNQITGKYPLILRGLQDCANLLHEATLIYSDASSDSSTEIDSFHTNELPKELSGIHLCHSSESNILCSMNSKSSEKSLNELQNPSATYYIPYDVNYYSEFTDEMTEYHFRIYGFTYYPSYLTNNNNGVTIAQINGMTFKYPPSPILSQPDAVPDEMICSLENRANNCNNNNPLFCECLQILSITPRTNVEIILIDEGHGGNVSHVFHVHGYSASVIGSHNFNRPITKDEIISLDHQGLLPRNTVNPPKMDTFVVPNKGYIILRFHMDNLGYWLWEARNTGVFSFDNAPAMQFLMHVGNAENSPTVPIDFPTCGNHKGPDLIFEDD
ncbi:hypothetical protein PV328_008225 [Microctonus aethiopoides]|uniref:Uncharacterized protein n=1 Tax=Microctonus aethiopoides TaxID=144406 RepID=A0AA39F125_9HYME|nr:hypothetical protein PV328_008225 [Microctonus aethiopoides]